MGSALGTIRAPSPRTVRLIGGFAAAVLLGITAELAGYLPHPWQYLSQLIYV